MRDGQGSTALAPRECRTCNSGDGVAAQLGALLGEIDALRASCSRLERALAVAAKAAVDAGRCANHDELTGLPNRRQLMHVLQQWIDVCSGQRSKFAILFIDLDGFKAINDHFGHAVGDRVLKRVAARILAAVRGTDLVARYGGDEFVVLLHAVNGVDEAREIATAIQGRVRGRYRIQARDVRFSASIGLALYPDDADHCSALLQGADADMYRRKALLRANVRRALT